MPSGFQIGPIFIHYYGIVVTLGALAGAWLATLGAKRRGHNPEAVWDLLVYAFPAGVIGARLWHVLTPPPSLIARGITTSYYLQNPLDAIAIWKGGLGIPGAVIGGVLALYWYAKRNGLNFLEWADIGAPSVALGQAIGRFGNFFNQELYGAPTDFPWKLYIDPAHRLVGYEDQAYYHPLFAYESALNLANMVLLLWLARRLQNRLLPGDVFLTYLVTYPTIRFCLDFLRLDASEVAGVNANQTAMAVTAALAVGLLAWRHFRRAPHND